MSTRCMIGIKEEHGIIRAIYCGHDGYVEGGVGEDLFRHYQEEEKIQKLMELGFISSLGRIPVSSLIDPDGCDDYAAREGMDGNEPVKYHSEEDFIDEEYCSDREFLYLWKEGEWHIANWQNKTFDKLSKLIS